MVRKKGIFFSIDALIALAVILLSMFIIFPSSNSPVAKSYSQSDLVLALSVLKVSEVNNTYMQSLIANGAISDTNKSVLEQIAEFYVLNRTVAEDLASSLLSEITTSDNIGIWFGPNMVASRSTFPYPGAEQVFVETQTISGIQEGASITSFSGRAFLTSSLQTKYFYFGGYVGEGNLSANVSFNGNISTASMELATTRNFSAYVNGNWVGDFSGSSSLYIPKTYNLSTTYFSSGDNLVELRSNTSLFSVAGGFIRVSYAPEVTYSQTTKKLLPGINGIVNYFDGFFVPGQLTSLDVFLRYRNNISSIMKIGSDLVYNGTTSGITQNISLNNTYLQSILNYSALSQQTTPIRLGPENATFVVNLSRDADVFSVVDLSGSMAPSCSGGGFFCCLFSGDLCTSQGTCNSCSGSWDNPLQAAKNATKNFTSLILSDADNRIGLVGYQTGVSDADTHNLSKNQTSLDNVTDSWSASGSTCICCGINRAVSFLVNDSSPSQFRSIVVMSDGAATTTCSEQPNSTAWEDAIQAACDAWTNYGIKVYAIGFGSSANETTLQNIAFCGQGSYYYSSISNLVSIYQSVADEIFNTTFFEQTVNSSGNYSSQLYPESYIEFDYNQTTVPFGLITTTEKLFDNAYGGQFSLPPNSSILEAYVVSYSGSWWTHSLSVNGFEVYNLSTYGGDYLDLGDPYLVQIPNQYINETGNNVVNLTTSLSSQNISGGSAYNKIIYTVLQKDVAAFSSISTSASGCNWTVEFEDSSNISFLVPQNYSGTDSCYYQSSGQTVADVNDALQTAVQKLFLLLDYDDNGKVDVPFSNQDLKITSSQITGIPLDWSTEMQVRVWR